MLSDIVPTVGTAPIPLSGIGRQTLLPLLNGSHESLHGGAL